MIEFQEGYHTYYVYILTNKAKTVLYTGVTNNLKIRLQQHKNSLNPNSFTAKYNVHFLLYFEKFTWIQMAMAREKEIKGWKKDKKIILIKTINPELNFLNNLFEEQNGDASFLSKTNTRRELKACLSEYIFLKYQKLFCNISLHLSTNYKI